MGDDHSSVGDPAPRARRAIPVPERPSSGSAWRNTVRSRILAGAVVFAVWTTGIQARLVYLQVIERADLQVRADRQHLRTIAAPAKRGDILDRNGELLAYSVDADTIFADPGEVEDPDKVSAEEQAVANMIAAAAHLDPQTETDIAA